ncbi:MAG: hypothetical protein AB7U61_06830 [Methylocystis sp.]
MKSILQSLVFIKERMATKDDLVGVKTRISARIDKVDDRLTAVESKIGGIHTRSDDETAQRKNLESRVCSIVPNIPPAPERLPASSTPDRGASPIADALRWALTATAIFGVP